MRILFIINDGPYGTEAAYNALRLARTLQKKDEQVELTIFLMGDGVGTAVQGQSTPDGYYNTERMLSIVIRRGATVRLCSACMDARGISSEDLVEGCERGSMDGIA